MTHSNPPGHAMDLPSDGNDRLRRARFHLWQIMISLLTVGLTVWIIMLGVPLLSITAIAVAKHVLVALLMMGLDVYPVPEPEEA